MEVVDKAECVELVTIIRGYLGDYQHGTALNALSWILTDLIETAPANVRLKLTNITLDAIRDQVMRTLTYADRPSGDA